jgi:hypothetical protein
MREWLLVTTSTPGSSSTLRVWAWRRLRGLGAHYLQQSTCVLPATPETRRAVNRVLTRLRDDDAHGQALAIAFTDTTQEDAIIAAFKAERADEYREVVERTQSFHDELAHERSARRVTYTELEESDANLAQLKRWLDSIRARDYFDAPGASEAIAAVESCERALAEFETDALDSELSQASGHQRRPRLRALGDE